MFDCLWAKIPCVAGNERRIEGQWKEIANRHLPLVYNNSSNIGVYPPSKKYAQKNNFTKKKFAILWAQEVTFDFVLYITKIWKAFVSAKFELEKCIFVPLCLLGLSWLLEIRSSRESIFIFFSALGVKIYAWSLTGTKRIKKYLIFSISHSLLLHINNTIISNLKERYFIMYIFSYEKIRLLFGLV